MRGHYNHDAAMDRIAEEVKNSAYDIISKNRPPTRDRHERQTDLRMHHPKRTLHSPDLLHDAWRIRDQRHLPQHAGDRRTQRIETHVRSHWTQMKQKTP